MYRLRYKLSIRAGERAGEVSREVGLGSISCDTCTDPQKRDLGGCPFLPGSGPGEIPTQIDSTGDEEHDWIRVCPRGLVVREPALALAVGRYHEMKAAGGPGAWIGRGPGLQPPRVSRVWAILEGVADRFQGDVTATRHEVDAEAARRAVSEGRNRRGSR